MNIELLTTQLIDKLTVEIKKNENMTRIQRSVIDPLIKYTIKCVSPYIITISVIFILTFILAIAILLLIIRTNIINK